MNIKKQLIPFFAISILLTTFAFIPGVAQADKHYKEAKHSKSYSKQRSSKSHSRRQKAKRHFKRDKKHYRHYAEPRRITRHYGHGHNQRNISINYYAYPWVITPYFFNDGNFSISYQDEHFGFTFRD